MLILENISLEVDSRVLCSDLCATIDKGQIIAVIGPSGIGKTSIISYIAGHLPHNYKASGRIILNGEEIQTKPAYQRSVGVVAQQAILFPHFNVEQNLLFALPDSVKAKIGYQQINDILHKMKLQHLKNRKVGSLSGGEAARISLLMTILSEPKILLLDEPFSSLDNNNKMQFQEFTYNLIKQRNIPTLCVTHDIADIDALGAQILRLG